MNGALRDIITREIKTHGPMGVAEFMQLALGHPQYGYYITRDPFGQAGDFITAPEISQFFGEMIGACLADTWLRAGAPNPFLLVEAGPGRGTLMADIIRATRGVPGFHDAAKIHFIETSPTLRTMQANALPGITPVWHDTIETLPQTAPVFFVGNEFLDALPLSQLVYTAGRWTERLVGMNDADELTFVQGTARAHLVSQIPTNLRPNDGDLFEVSPARTGFTAMLAERLARQGGVAILIDYGHSKSACGDTFQAMRAHKFVDVFDEPGSADLTSHVDFESITTAARNAGVMVAGPVEQGEFLTQIGINVRAQSVLRANLDPAKKEMLEQGLNRLIAPDEMGTLFKVLALHSVQTPTPPGFSVTFAQDDLS